MKTLFCEKEILYDGSQIRSLWAYREFGLLGDGIVAFAGACDVKPEYMVDIEDLRAGDAIFSRKMLHFIVEHFDSNLVLAVLRQRLLAAIILERIRRKEPGACAGIFRRGDDLFDGDAKLSVSIATINPVSTKIHFGLNIVAEGAPVKAAGLADYGIEAEPFAGAVMLDYKEEMRSAREARCRVRGTE